jgi:hypothetical protein
VQLRACPVGKLQMRRNAGLRHNQPGSRLEQRDLLVDRPHRGKAAPDLGSVEQFVGQAPLLGAEQAAGDSARVRPAEHDATAAGEDIQSGVALDAVPKFVRS